MADTNLDPAGLAKLLNRTIRDALRLRERPATQPDFTISEWCAKHNISRAQFYALKKKGIGPRTLRVGKVLRITHEADIAWEREHSGDVS